MDLEIHSEEQHEDADDYLYVGAAEMAHAVGEVGETAGSRGSEGVDETVSFCLIGQTQDGRAVVADPCKK